MFNQQSDTYLSLCFVLCGASFLFGFRLRQGQEYELADVCVESAEFSGTTCTVESVLGKWEYDSALLAADTNVLDTVSDPGYGGGDKQNMLPGIVGNGSFLSALGPIFGVTVMADAAFASYGERSRLRRDKEACHLGIPGILRPVCFIHFETLLEGHFKAHDRGMG